MLNIKIDSRKVKEGDTFVAIKGATVDGHDFIEQAIAKGATKIVLSEDKDIKVEKVLVKDTEEWLKNYLVSNYAEQVNKIKLVGMTGTNGKTTSCYLLYQMLEKLNHKCAYIGTIGFYLNGQITELPNTTPNILDLYDLILDAIAHDCKKVVMEVSSHALSLERVAGLKFDVVAFTNLTEDHLDYHHTMENYLQAKLKIIDYLKEDGTLIVNNDDEYSKYFNFKNRQTIGFKKSNYQVISYEDNLDSTNIKFQYAKEIYQVKINLKNKFNIYNYLTALACAYSLGMDINDLIKVTNELQAPKGRVEQIKIKEGLAVVDYAHTPDAVLKIITSFTENKIGKIYTILGCGGDRDPKKRPIMGNIATTYSDYVIFTNDNPRTEDEKQIMNDIIKGVKKDNYEIIFNREEAIKKGISLIQKNDILLVLGKGHENYQIIGHEKKHFDDMECLKKWGFHK